MNENMNVISRTGTGSAQQNQFVKYNRSVNSQLRSATPCLVESNKTNYKRQFLSMFVQGLHFVSIKTKNKKQKNPVKLIISKFNITDIKYTEQYEYQ